MRRSACIAYSTPSSIRLSRYGEGREKKKKKDDGIKVNYTMAQVPYLSGPCAGSTLDNSTPRNAKKH